MAVHEYFTPNQLAARKRERSAGVLSSALGVIAVVNSGTAPDGSEVVHSVKPQCMEGRPCGGIDTWTLYTRDSKGVTTQTVKAWHARVLPGSCTSSTLISYGVESSHGSGEYDIHGSQVRGK